MQDIGSIDSYIYSESEKYTDDLISQSQKYQEIDIWVATRREFLSCSVIENFAIFCWVGIVVSNPFLTYKIKNPANGNLVPPAGFIKNYSR